MAEALTEWKASRLPVSENRTQVSAANGNFGLKSGEVVAPAQGTVWTVTEEADMHTPCLACGQNLRGTEKRGVYQVLCIQCRSDQYHQESGFKHLESGRDVVIIKQNMRPVITISLEGKKSYALFSRNGHGRFQAVNWEVKPGDFSMIVLQGLGP